MARPVGESNHDSQTFLDTGCPEVSDSCLTCPLEKCKHDDPAGYWRWKRESRDSTMMAAMKVISVEEVAWWYKIAKGTVFKAVARAKGWRE